MIIKKELSLKCNLGNYQTADFHCSAEMESVDDSIDGLKAAGNVLHEYCKMEITKDVNNSKKYLQDLANGKVEEKGLPMCAECESPNHLTSQHPATATLSNQKCNCKCHLSLGQKDTENCGCWKYLHSTPSAPATPTHNKGFEVYEKVLEHFSDPAKEIFGNLAKSRDSLMGRESDPSADLLGEYPDSMNPPRKDKKTN